MSKFAIGEIAVFAKAVRAFSYEGQQVEVIALPKDRRWIAIGESWNGGWICPAGCYVVRARDGKTIACEEQRLRKLPGDSKEDFIPPEVRKLFIPNKEHEHV